MPVDETAWIIGFAIGAAVVVLVVLLLGTIIYLASRVRGQAVEILEALRHAKEGTDPLWRVEDTNDVAEGILLAAQKAREGLEG